MADNPVLYQSTRRFENVNGLYGNHFRFFIEALPDLTFFVTSVTIPGISSPAIKRHTPFSPIKEVSEFLSHEHLSVDFKLDAGLQTYVSLYWWMKGYAFPHSHDEVAEFRATRQQDLGNPYPQVRELEKTNATLSVLLPDTDTSIMEFRFMDVFPTAIGELKFATTTGEPEEMSASASFEFTAFDVYLP